MSIGEVRKRPILTMLSGLAAGVAGALMYEKISDGIFFEGGGGSGSVVVNPLAEKMGMKNKIAKNAPYISTIGVALAMVRETLERTVSNPTEDDIKKIRSDIIEQITRSGAKEETVDVAIEIDAQKNILRAIATGATEFRQKDMGAADLTAEQQKDIVSEALNAAKGDVSFISQTGRWSLFEAKQQKKGVFRADKTKIKQYRRYRQGGSSAPEVTM